jgi:TolA-binding protein
MTRRTIAVALVAIGLLGAAALADVCPLCLQQIPDGEKYCSRHKAELVARRMTSTEEQQLVGDLKTARDAYQKELEALEKFYTERANADGLGKIEDELQDFRQARHYSDTHWEDSLTDLAAKEVNPEADKLLAEADELRGGLNPFSRADRYQKAAAKYQEILLKYPSSTAVDDAAFGMGEIYSSRSVKEYNRAVRFYELAYLADPGTPHNALLRAAKVCDGDLGDYEDAARFYWLTAMKDSSMVDRKLAEVRLKELQKTGFGSTYSLTPVADEKAVNEGETK